MLNSRCRRYSMVTLIAPVTPFIRRVLKPIGPSPERQKGERGRLKKNLITDDRKRLKSIIHQRSLLMNFRGVIVMTVLLFVGVTQCWAETRYVSDKLVITLREGMGNQYRVIQTVTTDTPLEVLDAEGNYLFVRLENGTEGYVLKQYVSRSMPKTTVIAQLKQELAALEKKMAARGSSVNALSESNTQLETALAQTKSELEQVSQTLEKTRQDYADLQQKAENVVLIDQERQRLKKEAAEVSERLQQLEQENAAMLKTAMIKWFLAGGGVLFVGWVAGKFSRKKRRSLGGF
ncbi:MAG: TIGR04211 family SH3 domain-containing protein [Desulfuromonas sp.]|nr:MAG: TIGR04211 family SH3 domain-containing protein [Desulfuromonas sp.]